MLAALEVIRAVRRAGGGASLEHPADPGRHPLPSIWATAEWRGLARDAGLRLVRFDQCRLGAPSRKPTGLAASAAGLSAFEGLRCDHGPHEVLLGRDAEGEFVTKRAQAYPP
eukprot:9092872-Lingulodinium_polyedra.AAC.1